VTPVALLLCTLMTAGAMVACGGGRPRSESAGGDGGIVAALCEARNRAVHDAAEAEAIFLDRAHDGLHHLAREVAEVDRSAAARLLEAKQAVEADIERPSSGAGLEEHLEALIASTRRALELSTGSAPSCAQGGDDG
jgi:hypothetical protein